MPGAIVESGAQSLSIGAIADGQFVRRSGTTLAGLAADAVAHPYGMFSDSTTQAIANVSNAQAITFNTDVYKSGITHSTVTNPSRITIPTAGTYLITFSGIADLASGAVNKHLNVWLAVDGSPVADSNTIVHIPSLTVEMTVAVSFLYTFTANQYFELMTWGDATTCEWLATAAAGSPTRPACPSAIVTVNWVSG